MKCPVCDVELKIAERQGVEIDYCPNCRGVWLDRGELDKLIERSRSERERDDRRDSRDERSDYRSSERPDRNREWDEREREREREDDPYKRKKRRSFFEEMFDFD